MAHPADAAAPPHDFEVQVKRFSLQMFCFLNRLNLRLNFILRSNVGYGTTMPRINAR